MKKNIFEGEYGKKIKLLGIALITLIVVTSISLIFLIIGETIAATRTTIMIIGCVQLATIILTIVMLSITIHKSFALNKEMPNKKFNVIGIISSVLLGLFVTISVLALIFAVKDGRKGSTTHHKASVFALVINVIAYSLAIAFYAVSLWWILKQKTNKNVIDNDQEQVIEPNTNQE